MRYVATRTAYLLAVLLTLTLAVSLMLDLLPGDPAYVVIGEDATPAQIASVREALALDEPVLGRWASWLSAAVQGDLGTSFQTGLPVAGQLRDRLSVTVELVIGAQVLAFAYAFATTMVAVRRPGGWFDRATTNASFLMLSTPHFVLALLLTLLFASVFELLPIVGYADPSQGLGVHARSMILPIVALSFDPAGVYQRVLRSDMGRTMQEDFVTMAWAKGLSPGRVVRAHALRPSMFSLITVAGIATARLVGGSVVIETIFGLPGIGRFLVDSITARDLVAVQGVVAVVGVSYVVINSGIDVLYGLLNPRVRRAR